MQSVTALQLEGLERAYKAGVSPRSPLIGQSSSEVLGTVRHSNGCICKPCYDALQSIQSEPQAPQPLKRSRLAIIVAFGVFFFLLAGLLLFSPVMLAGRISDVTAR